jgi:tetratricopeptide (TPR) repeat protein
MEERMIVSQATAESTVAACDVSSGLRSPRNAKRPVDPLKQVNVLVRLGQHEAAAKAARRLLKKDANNLATLEILAKTLWQTCDMEGVVETTRRLVVLNPYEPGYHVLQASALQCLGRYGEAARAYARAGDAPGVRDAVEDLNAWQAGIVAELLATDTVFRAHYAQNPAAACAARGFSFLEGSVARERWLVSGEQRATLFTRPS